VHAVEIVESEMVQPLVGPRHVESQLAFEGASTRRAPLVDYLTRRPLPRPASVLSAHCKSGILDAPLAAALCRGRHLRYVGVDPLPLHCRLFNRHLAQHPVDVDVHAESFDRFRTSERFDLVLLDHAHDDFTDVPSGLARAARLLRPGGQLVIACSPLTELGRLANLFRRRRWYSADLQALFDRLRVRTTRHRIEAQLDVTPCLEGSGLGSAIRDCVVQADTSHLSPGLRDQIDRSLELMAVRSEDGRWRVPHPVDVFAIEESDAAPLKGWFTPAE
jgi:SAM-dependent methyltransferase